MPPAQDQERAVIEKGLTKSLADGLDEVFAGAAFVTHDTIDVSRVETSKWQIRVMWDGFTSAGQELPEGNTSLGSWGIGVVIRARVGVKDPDEVMDVGVNSIIQYMKGRGWYLANIENESDDDWHAFAIGFGRFENV